MIPSLAREIVDQHPTLPRVVPAWQLLRLVSIERTSRWVYAIAAISIAIGVALANGVGATSESDQLIGVVTTLFGIFIGVLPLVLWYRLCGALTNAPVGQAEVQQVAIDSPSRKTIDATKHGYATGVWIVYSSDGRQFTEAFEVDEAFAGLMEPGSRVAVLVHPLKLKTVFALGLVPAGVR